MTTTLPQTDRGPNTRAVPLDAHEAALVEDPAPWRTTYDLDWPMIVFWGGYLCVLALMTVCAGWSWIVEKVWP